MHTLIMFIKRKYLMPGEKKKGVQIQYMKSTETHCLKETAFYVALIDTLCSEMASKRNNKTIKCQDVVQWLNL